MEIRARLDEIKARLEKVTKGPFSVVERPGAGLQIAGVISGDKVPNPSELFELPSKRELSFYINADDELCVHLSYERFTQFPQTNPFGVDWEEMQRANAHLFANSREDIPWLISLVESLLKAGQFKRNTIIHDNPEFEGDWIAVPRKDFDAFRTTLTGEVRDA